MQEVAQGVKDVVVSELQLAKVEMREAARSVSRQGIKGGTGAVLLVGAGLSFLAFLVIGFGELIGNFWLSALIIAGVFAIVGGILLYSAVSGVKTSEVTLPHLQKSIQAQKENVQEKLAEVTDIARHRRQNP